MPSELDIEVYSRTGSYKIGIGGLHSTHDKKVTHVAGKDHQIMEIDAASFYPTIMLNGGLCPSHIGQKFIDEYQRIYDQRIKAKMSGDKTVADTLKISLNGTFGKLASKHSILYAPDLMLATTLTGQFTLLMLIEWFENEGSEIEILSANTDGICLKFPNFRASERAFQLMEQVSGRAGRKEKGKVIVQVRDTSDVVLKYLLKHDYSGLYHETIGERKQFFYPPFYRQIKLTLKHKDWNVNHQAALRLSKLLREATNQGVKGPSEPAVS